MKKIILVSVFCFVAIMNGYSQTKQESIKELFHVMKTDSLTDQMFKSMIPMMLGQMPNQVKDSSSRAQSEKMMNSTMLIVKDVMKKMMDEDMVTVYDKYFTQSEINDCIRFYKSSTGQKFVNTTPAIQKELIALMMKKYMPEIQKALKVQIDDSEKSEKK